MILGLTTENWIESLELKEQDKYLELVDALVIVSEKRKSAEPPFYFVQGDYSEIKRLLTSLSLCKAYPQRTWYTVNFSLFEIEEGMTPSIIKEAWINELQTRNLV